MLSEVKRASLAREFETSERCHITEVANDPGDELVSIARARVEPGVTTAWHKLDRITERYIIVSGNGRVEVDNLEPCNVLSGDVIRIPAGNAHLPVNPARQMPNLTILHYLRVVVIKVPGDSHRLTLTCCSKINREGRAPDMMFFAADSSRPEKTDPLIPENFPNALRYRLSLGLPTRAAHASTCDAQLASRPWVSPPTASPSRTPARTRTLANGSCASSPTRRRHRAKPTSLAA